MKLTLPLLTDPFLFDTYPYVTIKQIVDLRNKEYQIFIKGIDQGYRVKISIFLSLLKSALNTLKYM